MFQYAMGRALSLSLKVPLAINLSLFSNSEGAAHNVWRLPFFPAALGKDICVNDTPPSIVHKCAKYIKSRVSIRLGKSLPLFPEIVIEPHFEYWNGIAGVTPPAHLYGYWQSEKYFSRFAGQIRKDFAFPPLPDGTGQRIAKSIRSCPNAISVHIRRGDYVSNPDVTAFHGLMGLEYYHAALERIRAEVGCSTVYLFSDDPQWGQDNFDPCGHSLEVVDLGMSEEPHHDMHLMSLCRHHVIANSSFSWWGSWLGSSDGIVVAPKSWFADPSVNTTDICPQTWTRL